MLKLLRAIRFDDTDTRVFDHAADAGEWAVSGAFAFVHLPPDAIIGKIKQAFANGFFGVASHGRSTFATVGEVSEAERAGIEEQLAQHFVAVYGAPDVATALPAARDEVGFVADLCRDVPINTVFTVRRRIDENGQMKEEFRTIKPPSGEPAHAKIWAVDDGT